jgi:TPR repeat protein
MKVTSGVLLMIAVSTTAMSATGDDIPVRWEKTGILSDLTSLADLPRVLKKPVRANGADGLAFTKEREANPAEDAKRARPFYDRAVLLLKSSCDGGDSMACLRLGGVREHGLDAAPVDAAAANAAYRQAAAILAPACDKAGKDAGMACLALGGLYNYGQGVEKDKEKARTFFKRACAAGVEAACRI